MKAAKSQTMLPVAGTDMLLPVTELTGAKEGETITLSAGVHSREYAGVQALTELAQELDPRQVRGTIRLLHCCNYEGFLRRSADVVPQDGKNLNREFPGDPGGTPTQRLAAFLEQEFIERTDYLVDLHSGGFCESLTPHLYFHGTAAPEVRAVSPADGGAHHGALPGGILGGKRLLQLGGTTGRASHFVGAGRLRPGGARCHQRP